ncbi:FHA domain-containing protein [Bifidobacterium callitrichos]|uniref:FHA domain-containing protein n=1 Tax=Bifidobacterium callitrichos TaxID=762209 RepID=A0A5M9ZBW0_9BIFI|nr:FHA domain-containing protein [Bifidobacterium callitrichos]KAA8816024.1 FHA domain-containing protein [Bifidobacterium callitrichos]
MARTIPFPPPPEPGWYEDDAHDGHALADDIESIADHPIDAEALDGDGLLGIAPIDGIGGMSDISDLAAIEDAYPATSAAIPQSTVPMTVRSAVGRNGQQSVLSGFPGSSATAGAPTGDARSTLPRHQEPSDSSDAGADANAMPSGPSDAGQVMPDDFGDSASSGTPGTPAVRTYRMINGTTHQEILVDASMLLGRRPSNPVPDGAKVVQLDDPTRTISRNHATITMDAEGRLWLDDCDSLNGTYLVVDGHDVKVTPGSPVSIEAPAVIRFGDQLFNLQ